MDFALLGLVLFETCYSILLSYFSLLEQKGLSYDVFWKHITCLVLHVRSWQGIFALG